MWRERWRQYCGLVVKQSPELISAILGTSCEGKSPIFRVLIGGLFWHWRNSYHQEDKYLHLWIRCHAHPLWLSWKERIFLGWKWCCGLVVSLGGGRDACRNWVLNTGSLFPYPNWRWQDRGGGGYIMLGMRGCVPHIMCVCHICVCVEEPQKTTTRQGKYDWYHGHGKGISWPITGTIKLWHKEDVC